MLTPFDDRKNIDWKAFDPLVEWYIAAGSRGLFACCISSEILDLSMNERLQLARRTVQRAGQRLPVIAAGALGQSVEEMLGAAKLLADTGISALIFLSNQFATKDESDDIWISNAEKLLAGLPSTLPLGLYESPLPYKRVLSAKVVSWVAASGRFHFLKDTSCDLSSIEEKIRLSAGTPFRLYNANTPTLLPSLKMGGSGYSGVGCNLVPHLYAWLCENYSKDTGTAEALQQYLVDTSPIVDLHYPYSAEAYMKQYGLPITPNSRMVAENTLPQSHIDRFEDFRHTLSQWEERLGLTSPFHLI